MPATGNLSDRETVNLALLQEVSEDRKLHHHSPDYAATPKSWLMNEICPMTSNGSSKSLSLLFLCDGGGSNGARYHIFKQDLQALANDIGVEIRIAHYPPYTSKYNPIEHRLFPHVSRACQGEIFDSVKTVQSLMAKTSTTTGLTVVTSILDAVYETGRKASDDFIENMTIHFDDYLPKWNYVARPQTT